MRILVIALAALLMASCSVSSGYRDYSRGPDMRRSHDYVPGVASGSRYEGMLRDGDDYEMSGAFLSAMNGPVGATSEWFGRRSGASGMVTAGEAYLRNVDFSRGRRLSAPVGLYTDYPLEPAQGDYQVLSNANVRLGPSTDAPVVNTLTEGTVLEAAGHVRGQDWLLMARGGTVIGYMYGPLLQQRDGGDLLLAGGTSRTPTYCRDFRQSLRLRGNVSDSWSGTACRGANGLWLVEGAGNVGS